MAAGVDLSSDRDDVELHLAIKCHGAPIYYQTETSTKLQRKDSSLPATLQAGIDNGAGMVELPAGYTDPHDYVYIDPALLARYDRELTVQAAPAG